MCIKFRQTFSKLRIDEPGSIFPKNAVMKYHEPVSITDPVRSVTDAVCSNNESAAVEIFV